MSGKGEEEKNMEKNSAKNPKETEKNLKKSFFHIDREMLRFKVHFFLFEGGTASVVPFIPVVAKNTLGLSATSLAAVVASQQLITIISKPIIGYITDYFNKLKLMINMLLIIQTIFFFLILAIPPLKKSTSLDQLSLSSQVTNWTEISEIVIVKAYPSPSSNCSVDTTFSNIPYKNEKGWNTENITLFDVICLLQFNTSKQHCLQRKKNEAISVVKPETGLNYCCSAIHTENFTDAVQLYETINFRVALLDPLFSDYFPNKTFPCTMMITEDYDYSSDFSDFEALEFWMFAAVITISGICVSSIFSLSDTACCESVQKLGGEFGRQRMFGAFGWGALAAISGMLCDLTGGYLASWIFMAVLQMIAIWNISQLDLIKPHFSQSLLKDIGRVLKSVEFAAFELGVFFNGIGAGIVWFYLIWFLSGLGASKFLCGLTQYIECFLGEIPFMFFADWFIQKLGHFNLISISLLSYAARFLWYSYLQNPWLVLPAEISHGFTYGTLFPTVASYGKLSAKPGTEATTQSILFMTHGGLGAGLGCVLAGIFFDRIGPHQTFFNLFLMCSGAAVINIAITFYFRRRNIKKLNLTSMSR